MHKLILSNLVSYIMLYYVIIYYDDNSIFILISLLLLIFTDWPMNFVKKWNIINSYFFFKSLNLKACSMLTAEAQAVRSSKGGCGRWSRRQESEAWGAEASETVSVLLILLCPIMYWKKKTANLYTLCNENTLQIYCYKPLNFRALQVKEFFWQ